MSDLPRHPGAAGPVLHAFPYRDQSVLFKQKENRFVVTLFTGRTGTTFIQHSLNQHPNIKFEGEFLAEFAGAPDAATLQETRLRDFFSQKGSDLTVHAFKTKMQDVKNPTALRSYIMQNNCVVIHSYRKNIIKQCISGERSLRLVEETKKNTGMSLPYNLTVKSVARGIKPLGKSIIDKRRLDGAIHYFSEGAAGLQRLVESLDGIHVIDIAYEELNLEKKLVINALLSYFGLRQFEFEETILKHTSDDLKDVIENFGELAEAYRGTPYYPMFFESTPAF